MEDSMRFDIAPLDTIYRGIGRSLNPSDFYKKAKEKFDDLLFCLFRFNVQWNESKFLQHRNI